MAQDMAALGADLPAIMLAGRWKSPKTVYRYIPYLNADHTPLAQYLRSRDTPIQDGEQTPGQLKADTCTRAEQIPSNSIIVLCPARSCD